MRVVTHMLILCPKFFTEIEKLRRDMRVMTTMGRSCLKTVLT